MSDQPLDPLRLEHQLCFPLYAASRLVTRMYQPLLEPLGLTYPQYIVLLILWEDAPCTVSQVGRRALLNSNTLTPLLKRLEQLGYLQRQRSTLDERRVDLSLTPEGQALKDLCRDIPERLFTRAAFPLDQAIALKGLLDTLVDHLQSLPSQPETDL